MAAKPALSVIISCFNEEESIGECLRRTVQAVPDAEILVIHGGRDRTADIAEEMARTNPNITVIRNLDDRGKGHAIKVGIARSSADVMVQFDADLQFMPEEIPKVVRPIVAGEADFSFGARFMEESDVERYDFSFFRVMGNRIVNRYINLLTRQRFCDITTGFKAWTRDAIASVALATLRPARFRSSRASRGSPSRTTGLSTRRRSRSGRGSRGAGSPWCRSPTSTDTAASRDTGADGRSR